MASDPVFFVLRGYAVLQSATMPVIGDPETMNDSYVEQITAAAAAHIAALAGRESPTLRGWQSAATATARS